ncbi:MAG: CPXCG motif-containing cysteine-rich protein [Proteobacteria bacterium]|nr:MAG: CPXCG motif-containing cysteine-rich protein [Pseudomonadota bacterium]
MDPLQTVAVGCAICGETIEILVDCTIAEQAYVEDCQVCCNPLVMRVTVDEDGFPRVDVVAEQE